MGFVQGHSWGISYLFGRDSMSLSVVSEVTSQPPVILLAGVIWEFRMQRPQQLALHFHKSGSTVLYCSPGTYRGFKTGWKISQIQQGIHEIYFFAPKRCEMWELNSNRSFLNKVHCELQELIHKITLLQKQRPLVIVEHPFWGEVVHGIKDADILYDCLDDFSDFEDADEAVHTLEEMLVRSVDGIVSTAQHLDERWSTSTKPHCIIRNAADFEHFSRKPDTHYQSPSGQLVLGYHGAIEHWFDVELVEHIADEMQDCIIMLVGGIGKPEVKKRLAAHANIMLVGEVEYSRLPYYLYGFDIGLLPFLIQPLTLNTNPVKVYEYLAAGIPVVSVPLPEMLHFTELVTVADRDNFIPAIRDTLMRPKDVLQLQQFASEQTWGHRVNDFYNFQRKLKK